jgi:hypothetical protein
MICGKEEEVGHETSKLAREPSSSSIGLVVSADGVDDFLRASAYECVD